jgi:2'-5' RNA ligase
MSNERRSLSPRSTGRTGADATLRAFVALEAGEDFRVWLRPGLEALEARFPSVRWVAAGNLHLTLRFLGDVGVDAIGGIRDALRIAAQGMAPVVLEYAAAGGFGSRRSPRVLWLSFRDGPSLAAIERLVDRIESGREALGFARAPRRWSPHMTIGRNSRGAAVEDWATVLESALPGSAGAAPGLRVDHLTLFRSELTPRGAVYSSLDEVAFSERSAGC